MVTHSADVLAPLTEFAKIAGLPLPAPASAPGAAGAFGGAAGALGGL